MRVAFQRNWDRVKFLLTVVSDDALAQEIIKIKLWTGSKDERKVQEWMILKQGEQF